MLLQTIKKNQFIDGTPKWVEDKGVGEAEIVKESVCRTSLTLEARTRAWEFKFADLKGDDLIADAVLAQLQKRVRSFAPIAHSIMLEV